jgi:hypothetical protein
LAPYEPTWLPRRFASRIVVTSNGCWLWTGAVTSNGYGSISSGGRVWSTHRLAYTLLVGEIDDGLQLDHKCFERRCCNPLHLQPVTGSINQARARTWTCCPAGHSMSGRNVLTNSNGHRHCRACHNARRRRRREVHA